MAGPEIKTVIEMLRAADMFAADDLLEMRATMAASTANAPRPEGVEFSAVDAAGVPAEWSAAEGVREDAAIVYFHGGGYVMGGPDSHRGLVSGLSQASGVRVLSVDYRLAPEHRFPAAIEDAVSAIGFVREQGIDAKQIVVGGDSAGGGITASALVALRERGEPLPAAGVMISPWLDLTQSGETMRSRAEEDPMVTGEFLGRCADAYLDGQDPKAPLASPLFADLSGLPPLLVQVGTAEVLLDDARRFAKAATAAGVSCSLEEWEEMVHVWHAFAALLPEGQQAIERAGAFVAEQLGDRG